MIKLTREQTEQVVRHPNGVECLGDGTEKTFVIMDAEILRHMQHTLYQKDVHASIAEGIADMEAGRMMTVQQADEKIRVHCGFPDRGGS